MMQTIMIATFGIDMHDRACRRCCNRGQAGCKLYSCHHNRCDPEGPACGRYGKPLMDGETPVADRQK